jgi:hypothetical protein
LALCSLLHVTLAITLTGNTIVIDEETRTVCQSPITSEW